MIFLVLMVTITGQVVGSKGRPVSEAYVELVDAYNNVLTSVRTSLDGRFSISWRVKDGVYAVRAKKPGTITASVSLSVHKIMGTTIITVGSQKDRKTVRLQNQNKIDLGRLLLKSYHHAVMVTVIGLVGVFSILGLLLGVIRGANALFRRLS